MLRSISLFSMFTQLLSRRKMVVYLRHCSPPGDFCPSIRLLQILNDSLWARPGDLQLKIWGPAQKLPTGPLVMRSCQPRPLDNCPGLPEAISTVVAHCLLFLGTRTLNLQRSINHFSGERLVLLIHFFFLLDMLSGW